MVCKMSSYLTNYLLFDFFFAVAYSSVLNVLYKNLQTY